MPWRCWRLAGRRASTCCFAGNGIREKETWDGTRAGPDNAVTQYAADAAYPIGAVEELLPKIVGACDRVFYTMGAHPEFDQRLIGWVSRLRTQGGAGAPHAGRVHRARSLPA